MDKPKKGYVSQSAAVAAIEENLSLLDPQAHKAARNLTIALGYILQQQARASSDMDLLHKKLQPILKFLEEDNHDWRDRFSRYQDN